MAARPSVLSAQGNDCGARPLVTSREAGRLSATTECGALIADFHSLRAARLSSAGVTPPWVRNVQLGRDSLAETHAKDRIVVDRACGVDEGAGPSGSRIREISLMNSLSSSG